MDLLNKFINKGYFPKEVIPPFSTQDLSNNLEQIIDKIDNFSEKTSRTYNFSIPKKTNFRRLLGIPNPLHQIKLSKLLSDNWNELKEFVDRSHISLSTPQIGDERALDRNKGLSDIPYERATNSIDARYMLRTDISRYYSTIYSHSISWAIHSKEIAKKNRFSDDLIGNLIDISVRNTTSGQTLGIPIGPDTSLLIAEIIGTAMDLKIKNRIDELKGFRYVDDYYLYFSSLSKAESALFKLHKIMKEFELELNQSKTKIVELPKPLEKKWVSELRQYSFRDNSKSQKRDLFNYFNKVFEYANTFPNDYVIKYSLARIKYEEIAEENWELFESLLLKATLKEPSVLSTTSTILSKFKNKGYPLNLDKIKSTINQIIIYSSKLDHSYEIAWSLWLCKVLQIEIDEKISKLLSKISDNIVVLITLDLYHEGLINGNLDLDNWNSLLKKEELYRENWLLVYEAGIKNWLDTGDDFINNDPFFKELKDLGVEFYSTDILEEELEAENDYSDIESSISVNSWYIF